MSGPCGWTVRSTCDILEPPELPDPATQEQVDAHDAAVAEIALVKEAAATLLWQLTARVFGVCETSVRPCFRNPVRGATTYRGRAGNGTVVGTWWPGLINGGMFDGSCGCSAGCDCAGPSELALVGPVAGIVEVKIDGAVLDPSAYRVDKRRWLIRTDGDPWPQFQDVTADEDDEGSFVVKYRRGIPVPMAGQTAAGDLACELMKARIGAGRCAIPDRASSVARQGMNIELIDEATFFDNGLTGISSVDQWIMAVNPGRTKAQPVVFNPDTMRRR